MSKPAEEDYFAILELEPGASKAEVKRAYYKLAKQFHPDTVGGDAKCNPTAAAKFAELTRAYEIICEDIMGCTVDEVTEDIVAVMDQRDVPAEDAAEPEGSSDDNPEKGGSTARSLAIVHFGTVGRH